jgi:hypothetical protein
MYATPSASQITTQFVRCSVEVKIIFRFRDSSDVTPIQFIILTYLRECFFSRFSPFQKADSKATEYCFEFWTETKLWEREALKKLRAALK